MMDLSTKQIALLILAIVLTEIVMTIGTKKSGGGYGFDDAEEEDDSFLFEDNDENE